MDESTGATVAELLRRMGYDALAVVDEMRGAKDESVLSRAHQEGRILVTNDKELASLASSYSPVGVLLLRLEDEKTEVKLRTVERVVTEHGDRMEGSLIVASEKRIRIRPI